MTFKFIHYGSQDPQDNLNRLLAQLEDRIAAIPYGRTLLNHAFALGDITVRVVTDSETPNYWDSQTREMQINISRAYLVAGAEIKELIMKSVLEQLCKAINPLLNYVAIPSPLFYPDPDAYALEMALREYRSFQVYAGIDHILLTAAGQTSTLYGMDFHTYWDTIFNGPQGPAEKYRDFYVSTLNSYLVKLSRYLLVFTHVQFDLQERSPLDSPEVERQKIIYNAEKTGLAFVVYNACNEALQILMDLKLYACPQVQEKFAIDETIPSIISLRYISLETFRNAYLGAQMETPAPVIPEALPAAETLIIPEIISGIASLDNSFTNPFGFFTQAPSTLEPEVESLSFTNLI